MRVPRIERSMILRRVYFVAEVGGEGGYINVGKSRDKQAVSARSQNKRLRKSTIRARGVVGRAAHAS